MDATTLPDVPSDPVRRRGRITSSANPGVGRGQSSKFTAALHAFELVLWFGLVWSYFLPPIVAPLCASTLVLTYALRSSLLTGQLSERSFVLAFAIGNVGSMVYANAVYVTFTDLPQYGDHTDSMWMTTGLVTASFVGVYALELISPLRIDINAAARVAARAWPALIVTAAVYLVLSGLFYSSALNNRWTTERSGATSYIASGLIRYALPFLFVLGNRMTPGLGKSSNVVLIVVGGLAASVDMITGYRNRAILGFIAMGCGAAFATRQFPKLKRDLWVLAAIALPCVGVLFQVVGTARNGFAFSSIGRRIELVSETMEGGATAEDEGDKMLSRLFEIAGQDVIARVKNTGHEAGFEYFDRLASGLIPAFIAPNKEVLETGPETLVRDYQYQMHFTTSIPITLVADCYRRGGWTWILSVGFLVGIWLRLLTKVTSLVARGPLAEAAIGLIAVNCLRYYTSSVLGLISFLTWYIFKSVFIYGALSASIALLQELLGRKIRS